MLKNIERRSLGLANPHKFLRQESYRVASSLEPWRLSKFPKNHKGTVNHLDVDRVHGQFLLASSADNIVRVHNIHHPRLENSSKFTTMKEKYKTCSMKYTHEGVHCAQWYPNSISVFTSSSCDGSLRMWDTNSFRCIQSFFPCTTHRARIFQHQQSNVANTPLVAASSSEGLIPLVDLRYGSTAHRLRGHAGCVLNCKWSTTDENVLATAGADTSIRIWDIRHTQEPLHFCNMNYSETSVKCLQSRRTAHNGVINGLEFTQDGNRLVSFGKDCLVKVWDVYTGKPCNFNSGQIVNSIVRHIQLGISTNASPPLVYIPSREVIHTININTGERVNTLKGHYADVACVIYNPFKEEFYSSGKDREIMIWRPHVEHTEAIDAKINKAANFRYHPYAH